MKKRRVTAVLCALTLTAGMITGCGTPAAGKAASGSPAAENSDGGNGQASETLSEHVEISIGGINMGNSDALEGWPTEITEAVEKKFNITLVTKKYDNESLNLDLSGGTTCDILQVNDEHIEGILKGKHAVDLTQYKDTLAVNIFADNMSFRNEVMQKFKSNGEGGLYFVTPRVTSPDAELNFGTTVNYGYVVRWDLYKEIGCPEIKNDDDYVEALKKMYELYPTTEEGLPVYAMSAYNDSQLHAYFFPGCLSQGYSNMENGMYMKNVRNNEIIADIYDVDIPEVVTPFWAGISLYNKLYNAGILDPDCFITKGEDLTEKYTKGQYLGGTVNWYFGKYNENEKAKDPETMKQYVALPAYMGWNNERNLAGWQGKYFLVSSHSKNVERAVMVLDYLQSSEFSRIADSGVEGRWTAGEDGKPALTEDTINMKMDPARSEEWKKSGIAAAPFSDVAGCDSFNLAADGSIIKLWEQPEVMALSLTPVDKDMCKTFGVDLPTDVIKKSIEAGDRIDMRDSNSAIQFGMEVAPKDIGRIDSNCEQITINAIPGLVQAKTDEEFKAAKDALMQELKAAGVEDSIKWWTKAWNKSKTEIEGLMK